jgi:hypothetical protein
LARSITGVEPAGVVDRPGGGLRVVPVPVEHVGSPHPDLAGVADQHVVTVLVDEADLHPSDRSADRSHRYVLPRTQGDARAGLGEPVALGQVQPEPFADGRSDPIRQGRGTGHSQTYPGQRVQGWVLDLGQRGPQGGGAGQDRHRLFLDGPEQRHGIEALDQHQGGPGHESQVEQGVQTEYVEQGDDAQGDVVGPGRATGMGLDLPEIRCEVAVSQPGRLRGTCGPTREQEGGQVALTTLDDGDLAETVSEAVEVPSVIELGAGWNHHVLQVGQRGAIETLDGGQPGRADDHGSGAHHSQLSRDLSGRALGVQGHPDQAGSQHSEPGPDEAVVRAAQDPDPVAGGEAEPDETGPHPSDLGPQPPVPDPVVRHHQSGVAVGVLVDDGGQVHSGSSGAGPR